MPSTIEQLEGWMQANEGEALEFKAATSRYDFEKLTKYCVALANEGGGKVILGVSDARPRQVLGSAAFAQPEATESSLRQRLHLAITVQEIQHPDRRVVVIHIPPHPVGVAIQYDGRFWARDGESLIPMPSEKLRQIFDEAGHDFSADICDGLTLEELDPAAIERFRTLWIRKSQNSSLQAYVASSPSCFRRSAMTMSASCWLSCSWKAEFTAWA